MKNDFKHPALLVSACIVCAFAVLTTFDLKYFYEMPWEALLTFGLYWIYAITPYFLAILLYSIDWLGKKTVTTAFFIFHGVIAFFVFKTVFANENAWIWIGLWPLCVLVLLLLLVTQVGIKLFHKIERDEK